MKPTPLTIPVITAARVIIGILLTLLTVKAFAQDNPKKKGESPYFFVISNDPAADNLPLKRTEASVSIAGVIADVVVTQEYRNEGATPLEAIYTFPASVNAAVYAMEMVIGERRIHAKIEEKVKARERYEQARTEGKRASLLEQHRPNVFQMNVANIMPGDVVLVTLRYTELLVPEEGTYRFVYPTVVGPRYSGEGSVAHNNGFVSTPYTRKGVLPAHTFRMNVSLSAGMPVQHVASTTHQVVTRFTSQSGVELALAPGEAHGGNRDFVLEYKLAGAAVESGLLLYEHGDENFFLLMMQPPKRIVKEEIPPREYVFIVDVSGSMHGFPLETSKTLLRNLIANLKPHDRFNVLVFESGAYWLADESVPATTEQAANAIRFLERQRGGGGTNLLAAMKKAMSFPRHADGLSRSFVVVTDGYVDVEKEVLDIIRKQGNSANVFAFGIGSSVNRHIIDGIAHAGQSESFIVLHPSGADAEAEKFRKYINYPVLTNIKTTFQGFDAYDVEPLSMPDVMADRPVILYGKYRGAAKGTITIEGKSGDKKYKKEMRVESSKADDNHRALRYLWARKKIQLLDDYRYLRGSGDVTADVTRLGLQYNLLTAHTSFVAIEEEPVNVSKDLVSVKQPLPLPQGVEDSAVGFEMESDYDANISFHREIILPNDLEKSTKGKVHTSIERKMLQPVNRYLAEHNLFLEKIEVTVGIDGEIVTARFVGKNLSLQHQEELMKLILRHEFIRYKLLRVWKFAVLF